MHLGKRSKSTAEKLREIKLAASQGIKAITPPEYITVFKELDGKYYKQGIKQGEQIHIADNDEQFREWKANNVSRGDFFSLIEFIDCTGTGKEKRDHRTIFETSEFVFTETKTYEQHIELPYRPRVATELNTKEDQEKPVNEPVMTSNSILDNLRKQFKRNKKTQEKPKDETALFALPVKKQKPTKGKLSEYGETWGFAFHNQ